MRLQKQTENLHQSADSSSVPSTANTLQHFSFKTIGRHPNLLSRISDFATVENLKDGTQQVHSQSEEQHQERTASRTAVPCPTSAQAFEMGNAQSSSEDISSNSAPLQASTRLPSTSVPLNTSLSRASPAPASSSSRIPQLSLDTAEGMATTISHVAGPRDLAPLSNATECNSNISKDSHNDPRSVQCPTTLTLIPPFNWRDSNAILSQRVARVRSSASKWDAVREQRRHLEDQRQRVENEWETVNRYLSLAAQALESLRGQAELYRRHSTETLDQALYLRTEEEAIDHMLALALAEQERARRVHQSTSTSHSDNVELSRNEAGLSANDAFDRSKPTASDDAVMAAPDTGSTASVSQKPSAFFGQERQATDKPSPPDEDRSRVTANLPMPNANQQNGNEPATESSSIVHAQPTMVPALPVTFKEMPQTNLQPPSFGEIQPPCTASEARPQSVSAISPQPLSTTAVGGGPEMQRQLISSVATSADNDPSTHSQPTSVPARSMEPPPSTRTPPTQSIGKYVRHSPSHPSPQVQAKMEDNADIPPALSDSAMSERTADTAKHMTSRKPGQPTTIKSDALKKESPMLQSPLPPTETPISYHTQVPLTQPIPEEAATALLGSHSMDVAASKAADMGPEPRILTTVSALSKTVGSNRHGEPPNPRDLSQRSPAPPANPFHGSTHPPSHTTHLAPPIVGGCSGSQAQPHLSDGVDRNGDHDKAGDASQSYGGLDNRALASQTLRQPHEEGTSQETSANQTPQVLPSGISARQSIRDINAYSPPAPRALPYSREPDFPRHRDNHTGFPDETRPPLHDRGSETDFRRHGGTQTPLDHRSNLTSHRRDPSPLRNHPFVTRAPMHHEQTGIKRPRAEPFYPEDEQGPAFQRPRTASSSDQWHADRYRSSQDGRSSLEHRSRNLSDSLNTGRNSTYASRRGSQSPPRNTRQRRASPPSPPRNPRGWREPESIRAITPPRLALRTSETYAQPMPRRSQFGSPPGPSTSSSHLSHVQLGSRASESSQRIPSRSNADLYSRLDRRDADDFRSQEPRRSLDRSDDNTFAPLLSSSSIEEAGLDQDAQRMPLLQRFHLSPTQGSPPRLHGRVSPVRNASTRGGPLRGGRGRGRAGHHVTPENSLFKRLGI